MQGKISTAAGDSNISAETIASTLLMNTDHQKRSKKWTLGEVNELITGAPTFLITLGLIGLFMDSFNMAKLSLLLTTQENLGRQKVDYLQIFFPLWAQRSPQA